MRRRGPEMQSIPLRTPEAKAVRHAFAAREGVQALLMRFDLSEAEARVLAALRDKSPAPEKE